ncbi:Unknown protein [Striga hermonthica]|uniref:rRNA biogenesis protein RRP5 n=1 Tax=Striga hermonthica TaxID=68872 RepID=A0A9N7P231_STRHE|nr:Unknown protein [Striga hermonthica]
MAPPSKKSESKPSLRKHQRPSKKRPKPEGSNSDGAISSVQLPLEAEDNAPDFPRGGGSSLSREERNEARNLADDDFETNHIVLKKRKKEKRVQNRSLSTEDELGTLFGDGITGKFPRFANKITLKNVSSGMKLWGVIAEVNEKDIAVSLPGGLRGLVRASDAFDPILDDDVKVDVENGFLSRIYHEGQLVSCTVLQVDDDKKEITKRKIWLSLRLSILHKNLSLDTIQEGMVLSAYVKSIEDHGFMLHFGLLSFAGFMPKDTQSEGGNSKVSINQILQGFVKRVDRARKVVHLSSDSDTLSKSVTKELKGISIDNLVPGMLVNARVQSTLENGILFSFLTYFTGTVDVFNLDKTFPSSNWRNDYTKNMKFNARILFIDPSTRAVGLTLNPHLVSNKAPSPLVKIGYISSQSKIVRVDKGSGLLLEIPTLPTPTPAYVNVADVADKEVGKLEKNFKEGSLVRVRVLGYKHLEGLATGTLKTSAVEGLVFTHADVKPGMEVKAKVIAVDSFGAIVQFAGVKALCPLRHMSELDIAKPRKKFQVGAELNFRVLGCKSKRITVTHKKTLVKSKLPIVSSYADAVDGLVTHGWITKIEKHGCFVRFYNGVQGFAPRSELRLEPGGDISSSYHVEQVVKCRIVKCIPASRRINLSFIITPTRASKDENVKPGSLVSGVVEHITPQEVILDIDGSSHIKGTISREHLTDHHGLASRLMSAIKPGYHFDELLVLDIEGNNVILTAKYSLIHSAKELPVDISQVTTHSVMHGYICNIIENGCFVRYIGRLTGFAPKSKATDGKRLELSEIFYVGQSVRSNVIDVNTETGRITLSLKQSLCCSTDASFIQEYFLVEEKIAKQQALESEDPGLRWMNEFGVGSIIEGKIHRIEDYGVVISFKEHKDVYGFISHHQLAGTTMERNSVVKAAVLDVSKIERLVDLSLKPEFISRAKEENSNSETLKKKRKRETDKELEVNQTVNATVEIVKESYLVLSLPSYGHSIGYASLSDYNTQKLLSKQFIHGQSVSALVMALPATATGGRLLLLLKSLSDGVDTSSYKRAKKRSGYDAGSLVQAEITEIKPLELRVKFGSGFLGRIHITEVTDDSSTGNPFSEYRIGQTLSARIVSMGSKTENFKKAYGYELSIKPSLLSGLRDIDEQNSEEFNYSYGQHVSGYVYKTDCDWAWLTLSRDVRAQLYILDSSCEPSELAEFQTRFHVGKALSGYVISVNNEKKLLRIALYKPFDSSGEIKDIDSDQQLLCHIAEGSIVGGRISKILPGVGGLLVQIDHHHFGKVHFTELTNWLPEPLAGYRLGQFVKCKVLEINRAIKGIVHVDLSLRSTGQGSTIHTSTQLVDKITDLHPNMAVQGYIKNISPKGCFIMLSRKIDAKILLSNLSDTFVENPEKEFPIGKLVSGRVLLVEPLSKRIEVTLQTSNAIGASKSSTNSFSHINIGDVIHGRIKRVESYGLFISIDQTNVVGLCHVSELSDNHVDDLETKFKAAERVTAKVLKVDKERNRVSLGMKKSYFTQEEAFETSPTQNGSEPSVIPPSNSAFVDNTHNEYDHLPILADVESRAFVPPLDVSLDDIDGIDIYDNVGQSVENATTDVDTTEEKSKKKAKKKAREEREREIRAAEERLLEKDIPRSADEFEKLIRSSPNSSFIWIKYMAFMLSLADIEKARSIAERALQYCDPKKVHLALLGMYERTEQQKLADELLDKMCRKFKHSCKVWLRKIQSLLKENSDAVQSIVKRALLTLPRHKHIKFISQTAILEFKCGVPDRGRSMFEGMLREYPKRTDLWSVYLDQEIRFGDVDLIRALFERAISLSLPPRKMKFLFKKYLEYEKSIGDEERIKSVMNKAMAYADNTLA